MFDVTVVCVGNLKDKFYADACAEYEKRLSAYCRLKTVELKDGAPIIPHIPQKSRKVALCVEGKQMSSEAFAGYIEKIPNAGQNEVCFVIGGFDGLPEEVKSICDYRLSFSEMTFPHRLMRVILLEQIYRAFTIINGTKYHK